MPAPAPQYTIAKPPGGVLPVSGATTQNNSQPNGIANKANPRPPAAKLKVVIRRLPPGLTQAEFEGYLGEEWKPGRGKVSWASYKPGKIAKDLAKPSRPSRAYLQVTDQSQLAALSEKVYQTTFADALNTANDTVLIGPPALEFAPYPRIPTTKRRIDSRQGTLDQDPEYMNFLIGLTNPIEKPATVDSLPEGALTKAEIPTETPLIAFLRKKKLEKEAAKEAKAAQAKSGKHSRQSSKAESTETKNDGKASTKGIKSAVEPATKRTPITKSGKTIKDTVKIAKKDSVAESTTNPVTSQPAQPSQVTVPSKTETAKPARDLSNRRQEQSAAARIIQRDLGLRGGRGGSRRGGAQVVQAQKDSHTGSTSNDTGTDEKADKSKASAEERPTPANETISQQTITKGTSNTTSVAKRSVADPVKKAETPTGPATTTNAKPPVAPKQSSASSVTPTATRGFLKHANPSQGITEPLLKEALTKHGTVTFCEIDKRKGFAYVDFAEPAGLQNAISASPITVAQGSVVVLERKDRPATSRPTPAPAAGSGRGGGQAAGGGSNRGVPTGPAFRGGRGGSGRGRGGSMRGAPQAGGLAANPAVNASNSSTSAATTSAAAPANESG